MRTFQAGAVLAQFGDVALIHVFLLAVAALGAVAFVVWIISTGVAKGVKSAREQPLRQGQPEPTPVGGFPIEVNDGPGTFRVYGVDQKTSRDVTENIPADSSANAKVKAELRGIVVTRIERA